MRKILFLPLILLAAACGQEDILNYEGVQEPQAVELSAAAQRAMDVAIEQAQSLRGDLHIARSSDVSVFPASSVWSRSQNAFGDTSIYVVEFPDNQGFAVVNPYLSSDPVLILTDQGTFAETVDAGVPGFDLAMSNGFNMTDSSYIKGEIIIPPYKPAPIYKNVIDTTYYKDFGPKLNHLKWGQTQSAAAFCPNKIVGCGPLAIALACAYFKTPEQITYTFPNRDIGSETINWQNIRNITYLVNSTDPNILPPDEKTLARVCAQIGKNGDAEYDTDGTGMSSSDIKKAVNSVIKNRTVDGFHDYSILKLEGPVGKGLAILVGTESILTNGEWVIQESGHAWVADGYYDLCTTTYRYEADPRGITDQDGNTTYDWKLMDTITSRMTKVHCNFGWGGYANGYYRGTLFDVSKTSRSTKVKYLGIY